MKGWSFWIISILEHSDARFGICANKSEGRFGFIENVRDSIKDFLEFETLRKTTLEDDRKDLTVPLNLYISKVG